MSGRRVGDPAGTVISRGGRRPCWAAKVNWPRQSKRLTSAHFRWARKNPLPYRQLLKAVRALDTGQELLRDAGGPITRLVLGPKWMVQPIVLVTSPNGIRDVLGRVDEFSERCDVH